MIMWSYKKPINKEKNLLFLAGKTEQKKSVNQLQPVERSQIFREIGFTSKEQNDPDLKNKTEQKPGLCSHVTSRVVSSHYTK